MNYTDKAFEIVKHSINSAIFIDEKAKEFYSGTPVNNDVIEEKLSVDLFNGFKSDGISLAVHKFKIEDITNKNLKQYLLKDRDLVLLDWELDAYGGIDYSLNLLSEVIEYPHINFCCIYTSTSKFDDISKHINTYFSGFSKDDYEKVLVVYSYIDAKEFLEPAIKALNSGEEDKIDLVLHENSIDTTNFPLEYYSHSDILNILINSFCSFEKSKKRETKITSSSKESGSFIINNTFVFVLKKDIEHDISPSVLIKRISDELTKNRSSFIQLLGLEMQTIFNNNESFINENMFQSSTNAFFTHRNYLKAKNENDIPFNTLIKKVLIEHATLRLRTSKLSLLDTSFLDEESTKYDKVPTDAEIASMNTFYNSVTVSSLNDTDFPNVNFGDIFIDSQSNYYLCITALCDCLRPKKIKQNYFFVIGSELSIEIANSLGDSAFISYIPGNKAISWVNLESTKKVIKSKHVATTPKKILEKLSESLDAKSVDIISKKISECLTEKEQQISSLNSEIEALKQFKYKPVYIQPHIYNIKNPKIEGNTIEIRRVESVKKTKDEKDTGNIELFNVKYVTTLRPNYTQRIANHTFAHSVRVGVDFVSKI